MPLAELSELLKKSGSELPIVEYINIDEGIISREEITDEIIVEMYREQDNIHESDDESAEIPGEEDVTDKEAHCNISNIKTNVQKKKPNVTDKIFANLQEIEFFINDECQTKLTDFFSIKHSKIIIPCFIYESVR